LYGAIPAKNLADVIKAGILALVQATVGSDA
jgi:hypothetical protein